MLAVLTGLLEPPVYHVAAVTVANGGDNISIYVPLFAKPKNGCNCCTCSKVDKPKQWSVLLHCWVAIGSPLKNGSDITAPGGFARLLERQPHPGRKHSIPQWAQDALSKRLEHPEGFNSYSEICQWLQTQLGISAPYKTVHQLVHYRLGASPKVARPQSVDNTDERVEAYKKTWARI